MKIAEETGDPEMKEAAKVNFGMANASMKWNSHINNILQSLEDKGTTHEEEENEEDEEGEKLPPIQGRIA
jgi:hypothetical protein